MLQKISLALAVCLVAIGVATSVPLYAVVPGTNTLVSYDATGALADFTDAHVSEDGNIVMGLSWHHDLIPSDPYSSSTAESLYMRNMQSGSTAYVAVEVTGAPAHVEDRFVMSRTGRYVAFSTKDNNMVTTHTLTTTNRAHLYLRDTLLNTTTLVDQSVSGVPANLPDGGYSYASGVSDDGRFVVFDSISNNLLSSGNPSTISNVAYMKDMLTGEVVDVAVSNAGVKSNKGIGRIFSSCDGAIMAFTTDATNLTPQDDSQGNVYVVDVRNGFNITNLTHAANSNVSLVSVSCNGRYLVLASAATNLTSDTVSGTVGHYFRYDRVTHEYVLIDKSTSGYISSSMPISNQSYSMRIVSDDGKVVFKSSDKNLVSPMALRNYEIYLRNPEANTTELVPINSSGTEQNANGNGSGTIGLNARGNTAIYESWATNLIPGVTANGNKIVLSKVE